MSYCVGVDSVLVVGDFIREIRGKRESSFRFDFAWCCNLIHSILGVAICLHMFFVLNVDFFTGYGCCCYAACESLGAVYLFIAREDIGILIFARS